MLDLPLAPSVNGLKDMAAAGDRGAQFVAAGLQRERGKKLKVFQSEFYVRWTKECDGILMACRGWREAFIDGRDVSVQILLDEELRPRGGDVDNRIKATLDFLQRERIVKNDKQVYRVEAEWVPLTSTPMRVNIEPRGSVPNQSIVHVRDPSWPRLRKEAG